jgi:hypothetical protein
MWYRRLVDDPLAARFDADCSVDQAIARLASAAKAPASTFLSSQDMLGRVSRERVELERAMPFQSGNSWKPVFVGRFEEKDGRAFLVGVFGLRPLVRGFMYFFIAFCLLWSVGAFWSIYSIPGQNLSGWLPFAGIGMAALCIAFSRGFGYLSRADIPWIAGALSGRVS